MNLNRPNRLDRRHGWWALAGGAVSAALYLLYKFPPGSSWFYPRCLFHQLTGWNCPGCGGLRATHHLLHGHFREAFLFNPLLFVLAPWLLWFGVALGWGKVRGEELPHPFRHPAALWVLAILVVVFGILRNLPMMPFRTLPPS